MKSSSARRECGSSSRTRDTRYVNPEVDLMFPVARMRFGLRPVTRVTRSVLLTVLTLAGLPDDVFAQSPVCHATRRGESATEAARRVTGEGRNAYQTWFQIMDPSSRFVPKSQYDRIRAGWRACVIKPAIRRVPSIANHIEASEAADGSAALNRSSVSQVLAAPAPLAVAARRDDAGVRSLAAASDVFGRVGRVDLTMVWLCAAMVVLWFGWRIVDDYFARRKTTAIVVGSFVHRFVDEFERPLVRYDLGERPVKSRLRCGARRGRFDILLAPGEGRRYPNLSDHKRNLEYDVARVMRVLADDLFVSGAPYRRAGWIVVPFRFTADSKQSGVACISSL